MSWRQERIDGRSVAGGWGICSVLSGLTNRRVRTRASANCSAQVRRVGAMGAANGMVRPAKETRLELGAAEELPFDGFPRAGSRLAALQVESIALTQHVQPNVEDR